MNVQLSVISIRVRRDTMTLGDIILYYIIILVRKSFVRMYVMAQEGTRDYLAIRKGRGFVYAHANQLYNRV